MTNRNHCLIFSDGLILKRKTALDAEMSYNQNNLFCIAFCYLAMCFEILTYPTTTTTSTPTYPLPLCLPIPLPPPTPLHSLPEPRGLNLAEINFIILFSRFPSFLISDFSPSFSPDWLALWCHSPLNPFRRENSTD